jgi:NAD(P)-dependent dehydrogenase (short-subunit alcohol dehydrogenase family)
MAGGDERIGTTRLRALSRASRQSAAILRRRTACCALAAKRVPLKRRGVEAEVSAGVIFLLSEAAAYVSGALIRVDGALHNVSLTSFYETPDHARSKPYNGFPLATRPKAPS